MDDAKAASAAHLAEAARRTLKTLAERRRIPTPEAFAEVYYEVNGGTAAGGSPVAVLREILRDLSRTNRVSAKELALVIDRGRHGDWATVQSMLEAALARGVGGAGAGWPQTTLALLRGADALHAHWTRARKLEAVAHVIETAAAEPDVALDRVRKLIDSWGPPMASVAPRSDAQVPAAPPPTVNVVEQQVPAAERYADPDLPARVEAEEARARAWKQIALRATSLLEHACGEASPAAARLRTFVSDATADAATDSLLPRFIDAVAAIERQIEDEHRIKAGLQRLLGLLCDNMKSLTPDEVWLAGQLEPIRSLLDGPLTPSQLSDAEEKLAHVIERQSAARRSLSDAKLALKEMLSTLVTRIGTMGDSTGRFYEQISSYQKQMEEATDFKSLSHVVGGLLNDTEAMRGNLQASREELEGARRKVEIYETRMRDLERELAQVSSLVQKDPLTQVLNRRGFEEAFRIESARATRYGTPLAVVLIDLDNFKKLNDSLGHLAGDRALVHLVQTIRASLRPTDLLARIGGEEFCVLLPATTADDAVLAVERCLRMLAANPFRFEEDSRILTFSGGAALWRERESLDELIKRADETMYAAKRAGKNRVLRAGDSERSSAIGDK
jgi:diguanylate cyclase